MPGIVLNTPDGDLHDLAVRARPSIMAAMTANRLEVRSNEAGASLAVQRDAPERCGHRDDYWVATLSCGSLRASLRFYELEIAGLAEYLEQLATDWRGWKGERRWESLEGDVALVATHDGLGTIALTARLGTETSAIHRWTASADLRLDAGSLDRTARNARRLSDRTDTAT